MQKHTSDQTLNSIIGYLKKLNCHTALLYGSRARGTFTEKSDYDVIGIRTHGAKTRMSRNKNGCYWDILFIQKKIY